MELFRIIKKALLLIRDEVKQSLKDSKEYTNTKVAAEAKRADNYADEKEQAARDYVDGKILNVNDRLSNVNDILSKKLDKYTNYYPSSDLCISEEAMVINDPDYIEWNILRKIYTKGFVGKNGFYLTSYYSDISTPQGISLKGCDFFIHDFYPTSLSTDRSGVSVVYNWDIAEGQSSVSDIFYGTGSIKYVSSSSINAEMELSINRLFYNCRNLIFIDFEYPRNGLSYDSAFNNCQQLRHRSNSVILPNATSTSYMFYNNEYFGTEVYAHANHDIEKIPVQVDVPNSTTVELMFYRCLNILDVSLFNAPRALNAKGCFNNCLKLKTVQNLDISDCNDATSMFSACFMLTTVSIVHSEDVDIKANYMFSYCESLTDAPRIAGTLTSIKGLFTNCHSLVTVPLYKVVSETIITTDTFNLCEALTNVGGFDGLASGLNFSDCPLLTRESCVNLFTHSANIAELNIITGITLHSEAYARLSEEDIAIAVNKGWTVESA